MSPIVEADVADSLPQHLLLFLLLLPCLIPGLDTMHSTMLCKWEECGRTARPQRLIASPPAIAVWLRPSKQIRSPIFSLKQRALRRKIIVKYGVLFACVMFFFGALIILPVSLLQRFDLMALPAGSS